MVINFRMPDFVKVRFRDGTHSITSFAYVDENECLCHTIAKAEEAITDKIKRIAKENNLSEYNLSLGVRYKRISLIQDFRCQS